MSRPARISPCFNSNGLPKQRLSQASAEAAAGHMNLNKERSKPVVAYECVLCGAWHVGRQKSRRWRRSWTSNPRRRERRRDEYGDAWE